MEKHALVLALALTLPLVLYGVPYAYASVTSSSYVVYGGGGATPFNKSQFVVYCHSGDYVTGGGFDLYDQTTQLITSAPLGQPVSVFEGWYIQVYNPSSTTYGTRVWAVCQTPIVVAGVSVPEFGSLYVAIALGAVVYFTMSRRLARRPTMSALVNA
jgi:hypothetical protein